MRFGTVFSGIFSIFLVIYISQTMADQSVSAFTESFAQKLAVFAVNIYSSILLQKPNENVVISPLSIQTCAAMARLGAENETALELERGLGLSSLSLDDISAGFYNILKAYEGSDVLKIANKIYINNKFTLENSYNEVLSKNFLSSAESISFKDKSAAAANINNWVEKSTNHLIKNLVSESDLGDATRLLLINAIHFKGQWRKKFRTDLTANEDFYLNDNDKVQVPMMHVKGDFKYAYLPELQAAILELPYENTDLSMLVILPDSRTGLKALEEKLKNVDFNDIVKRMRTELVVISLPKFKTEFSIELTEPLKKLGILRMFSDNAEFGKMINPQQDIKVSKVIHKAFIEVNEEGTEAAAATGLHTRKKRSIQTTFDFLAEHPFLYVVASMKQQILHAFFMGSLKIPIFASESSHDEL